MPVRINAADGYLMVEVAPADGGDTVEVALDLYEANNVYVGLCDAHPDPGEVAAAWVAWLGGKGVHVPHAGAWLLLEAVWRGVDEFKKKFGTGAPSPTAG